MSDLKDCPKCGKMPEIRPSALRFPAVPQTPLYHVACSCGLEGLPAVSQQLAAEEWNIAAIQ